MVAMAGGAGRRTQIAAHSKGVVVHAVVILSELVCRDGIALHVRSVSVATRAGLRNVQRMNF